ncbi:prolyl oligopeptidase family serine peptidase [Corynebacterium ulceribovis]|uniref:prolyl oligopeptidase family serine peptidase n=1 Tax=Corynebacterium ulceribovis TaxID=487732 RepID=UPI00036856B0|nr:prolyl oligopeptidase family serine peptidase [Corynebacterium ulceribovis]
MGSSSSPHALSATATAAITGAPPAWLDDIDGDDALGWATDWSERTTTEFANPELQDRLRTALDTDDRIPFPRRRGDWLYNFWRDANHPRGLWRRCPADTYLDGSPQWQVLIDVDQLAELDQENWVWKGAHVRYPAYDRALVRLSRGGSDATIIREFDIDTASFIPESAGGFTVPEAKSDVSWLDRDTLLVGTNLGPDSLTASGYPRQIRRWERGAALADADILFTGEATDVAVGAWHDATEGFERTFIERALDFYRSQRFLVTDDGLHHIDLPEDCEFSIHRHWLVIIPRTDYLGIAPGTVALIDFAEFLSGDRNFTTIFSPTATTSFQSLAWTKDFLILTLLNNVATQLVTLHVDTWEPEPLPLVGALAAPATTSVIGTNPTTDNEVWLVGSSYTQPATLLRGSIDGDPITTIRKSPELFDVTGLSTRQHTAISQDGTAIPYFITGAFDNEDTPDRTPTPKPTLVSAYGGFEVSLVPGYSATCGIGWLSQGGNYVVANLRGGGEFGPDWHTSVTGANRTKIYEDHQAVLEDLVTRGYATSDQLGIRGGSNGGLLTAVALTSYPEAFGAAVSQVPLIDMLRYHELSAGASWMAEYGDPEDPQLRAVLESYSPLHNVNKHSVRPYPPTLVTTSTRDDRVHPAHARTFAWALAAAHQPVDYFENTEGGHGGAADNAQIAQVEALIYTWLWRQIGGRGE